MEIHGTLKNRKKGESLFYAEIEGVSVVYVCHVPRCRLKTAGLFRWVVPVGYGHVTRGYHQCAKFQRSQTIHAWNTYIRVIMHSSYTWPAAFFYSPAISLCFFAWRKQQKTSPKQPSGVVMRGDARCVMLGRFGLKEGLKAK